MKIITRHCQGNLQMPKQVNELHICDIEKSNQLPSKNRFNSDFVSTGLCIATSDSSVADTL